MKQKYVVNHYGFGIENQWTTAASRRQALVNVLKRLKRMDLYPKIISNLLYTVRTEGEWKKDKGKFDEKEGSVNRLETIAKKITAIPMAVYDVDKAEVKKVLNQMREDASASGRNQFFEYYANQKGSSNKFLAFAIFEQKGSGQFVAMNAYGRIGYPPRFHYIGKYEDKNEAMSAVLQKIRQKVKGGYEEVDFDG